MTVFFICVCDLLCFIVGTREDNKNAANIPKRQKLTLPSLKDVHNSSKKPKTDNKINSYNLIFC
jgi:hypothetical protein